MSNANSPSIGAGAGVRIENNHESTVVEVGAGVDAQVEGLNKARNEGGTKLVNYSLVDRDPAVFYELDLNVERVSAQIKHVRSKLISLVPMEKDLNVLTVLRKSSRISPESRTRTQLSGVRGSENYLEEYLASLEEKMSKNSDSALSELSDIMAKTSPQTEAQILLGLVQRLWVIADQIDLRIANLRRLFNSAVYPALSSGESVENMISKIGNRKLHAEAEMHRNVIHSLVKRLDDELLTGDDFKVLSNKAETAVGVMLEAERSRLAVEELVCLDQRQQQNTVFGVTGYIVLVLALAVAVPILLHQLPNFDVPVPAEKLEVHKLRLIGIPWPVIIWSLIGSFAAMIHRFNRRPVYDFSDAVKWMLTRHVQGVVLGSTFYLVLVSGLFLLTDGTTSETSIVKNEVILVLSFLIGFSDRFVDSVFNALVDRYSSEKKDTEPKVTDESIEKQSSRSSDPPAKRII